MKKSLCLGWIVCVTALGQETFPPRDDGLVPQTVDAVWAGFDPRSEPLEVEVLKEWEEDGVVLQVLRYRIGMFKGQKAMMAAVYGYPKNGKNLPGLVQIHGGGQYADYKACLTNAKRGYATLSISWAGRISAPNYTVNPDVVNLFWEQKTNDPAYRVTTDWGGVDGYHAPSKNKGNQFPSTKPATWTIDSVESPRNSPWFLCTVGARRGLTFLEQQPQVDGQKLGVYGHSMGGKLTVLTAGVDSRVKAAAPSCGGISDRGNASALYRATMGDDPYLKHLSCPTMFLSPANDFHGLIDDLQTAITEIKSSDWRVTCAPHHNHQDTANYEVATQIWFDQYLKGSFACPETPPGSLSLKTASGIPSYSVSPDASRPVRSVDIFYTQHGQLAGAKDDMGNTKSRFWHHATAVHRDGVWTADLPLSSTDKPLWVYANVVYGLDAPITGAGYYYGVYTTDEFNLSSLMEIVSPKDLVASGVLATVKPSLLIEAFDEGWEKEWFSYRPAEWARTTHKLYDPKWAAPEGASMAIEVRSAEANTLVVGLDGHAAAIQLSGGGNWESFTLPIGAFKDAKEVGLPHWAGIKAVSLQAMINLKSKVRGDDAQRKVGGRWNGAPPEFRNLRWVVK